MKKRLLSGRPRVIDYEDFRAFLKDFIAFLKTKGVTFRDCSRSAGFRSSSFLKRVIEGEKNLSEDSIVRLVDSLQIGKDESKYLQNLIHLQQAKSIEIRHRYAKALAQSKGYKKSRPISHKQHSLYSPWFNVVVRELVGTKDFNQRSLSCVARSIHPSVTQTEIKKALKDLEGIGLIEKDERGDWIQTKKSITTENLVTSTHAAHFHRVTAKLGMEAIDRFEKKDRSISSVTLSISAEKYEKLRLMVADFRTKLIEEAESDDSPTDVYQLNFQLFPLAKKKKGGSS